MNGPHANWALHYDEVYRRSFGDLYDALTAATVEFVLQTQPLPARIVDFGAGTGRVALPLARAGYSVTALDPCAEMLSVLRSKAETKGLTIETICGRMQDEFQSPPFDFALCVFTVLLYLLDDSALDSSFKAAAAALRPGGRLLLDMPSRQIFASYSRTSPDFVREVQVIPENDVLYHYVEEGRMSIGDRWISYQDSFRIRYWEPSQVLSALDRAGFVLEQDLSPRFARWGSNYYLLARPARG